MRRWYFAVALALLASCAGRQREYSVTERLEQFGPVVAERLTRDFAAAGLHYPPHNLALLAFKDTSILEVYARNEDDVAWTFVKRYPVLAASGHLGPKLAEGDRQVPEGVYEIQWLNPNSREHLSLMLDYPNAFDELVAQRDGRTNLGSNIMVHGGKSSIGCLAIGDEAAEDLFVLAALATSAHIPILVSPTDFRVGDHAALPRDPAWLSDLYDRLRVELRQFPRR